MFDKHWPWYEPNEPDTKQVDLWVYKNEIAPKHTGRPGTGMSMLLVVRSVAAVRKA